MNQFIHTGSELIASKTIELVDLSELEQGCIFLYTSQEKYRVEGTYAIETVMLLKPSALEGTRLKWLRHKWMVHNFIGHPLMQLAALFHAYAFALWIHEMTIPKPLGFKTQRTA